LISPSVTTWAFSRPSFLELISRTFHQPVPPARQNDLEKSEALKARKALIEAVASFEPRQTDKTWSRVKKAQTASRLPRLRSSRRVPCSRRLGKFAR